MRDRCWWEGALQAVVHVCVCVCVFVSRSVHVPQHVRICVACTDSCPHLGRMPVIMALSYPNLTLACELGHSPAAMRLCGAH